MNKEGSLTARMYTSGYPLTCRLGFQKIENGTYESGDHAKYADGIPFPVLNYVKKNHLCASTGEHSIAVVFNFEHVGNGEYITTSANGNFFPGYYLEITSYGHVNAYKSREKKNNFLLRKTEST